MIFSDNVVLRTIVFVLGVCGFLVAKHIHKHKKVGQKPLICPAGFNCNAVVHSDYSKFLGIPVEFLGMIYYALVSIVYFVLIFEGEIIPDFVTGLLMMISLMAFLFSLYLIMVQVFILKKGCSWCIVSAIISACIFILTIFAYDFVSIAQIFTN